MDVNYKVLVVDDRADMLSNISRELTDVLIEGKYPNLKLSTCQSFDEAQELLRAGDFDLAILDVREEAKGNGRPDNTRGTRVFEAVRLLKFLPIIFFTALPEKARMHEAPPLITVVDKDDIEALPSAVEAALKSGISTTVRTINEHVDRVIRNYLWTTVAPSWKDFSGDNPEQIAELLVARVTRSLQENALAEVRKELEPTVEDDSTGLVATSSNTARYYVYPPVNDALVPGALVKAPWLEDAEPTHLDGNARRNVSDWWVVLTPSCDFAQNKVEYVLLAQALPLEVMPLFASWKEAPEKQRAGKWSRLEGVLRGNRPRYEFYPKFQAIPDLVVDLEQVIAVPNDDLIGATIVASLSSPFTEALLTKYSHFRGRIGTPDVDINSLKLRLDSI
ncbi:hypothetical protein [Pseudarthrobacter oxydans]|uniref:hypothetical protein n=1 Tax=Pseudarthrobacter oxydans TaxID=1671 RepID=UPI00344B4813